MPRTNNSEITNANLKNKIDLSEKFLDEFIRQTCDRLNKTRTTDGGYTASDRMKMFSSIKKQHKVDDYWSIVQNNEASSEQPSGLSYNDIYNNVNQGVTLHETTSNINKENQNDRQQHSKDGFNNEDVLNYHDTTSGKDSMKVDDLKNSNPQWSENARADRILFESHKDHKNFKLYFEGLASKEIYHLKSNPAEFKKLANNYNAEVIQDKLYNSYNMGNLKTNIFARKQDTVKYGENYIDKVSINSDAYDKLSEEKSFTVHKVRYTQIKNSKGTLIYEDEKGEKITIYNTNILRNYSTTLEITSTFVKTVSMNITKGVSKDFIAKFISFIGVGIYAEFTTNDDSPFLERIRRFFKAIFNYIKKEIHFKALLSVSGSVIMSTLIGFITEALGIGNIKIIAQALFFAMPQLTSLIIKTIKKESISWSDLIGSIFKIISATLINALMEKAETFFNTLGIPDIISIPITVACCTVLIIMSNELIDAIIQQAVKITKYAKNQVQLAKDNAKEAEEKYYKIELEENVKHNLIKIIDESIKKHDKKSVKTLQSLNDLSDIENYECLKKKLSNIATNIGIDEEEINQIFSTTLRSD